MNPHHKTNLYMPALRAFEQQNRKLRLHRFIGLAGFALLIAVVVAAAFSGVSK
jgi:hypothetical protein